MGRQNAYIYFVRLLSLRTTALFAHRIGRLNYDLYAGIKSGAGRPIRTPRRGHTNAPPGYKTRLASDLERNVSNLK